MSAGIERAKVTFTSGDVELTGYLFRPGGATAKLPCVVIGHGFSGTQDRLFDVAERFAAAGFSALTFDYRSFGESGGEPRQVVSVKGQLEDWQAAVRFARGSGDAEPERIALWGSSLGGGHARAFKGVVSPWIFPAWQRAARVNAGRSPGSPASPRERWP